ncbi:MAG: hypothetical protein KME13_23895 [Myxacorys californica WJT36-NPBG1]|jgi:hypothetical protein|nr:hypothetical protein [Myxacorys californica WJT36-NPBG1]
MYSEFRAELSALDYRAVHSSPLLVRALAELQYWEEAKERFKVGTIVLAHDGCQWIIKVSADLVQKILPF